MAETTPRPSPPTPPPAATDARRPLWAEPRAWAELFALSNLAFLGVDIALAHAVNQFRHPAEYAPLLVSAGASGVFLVALLLGGLRQTTGRPTLARRTADGLAILVGLTAVVLGVAGLLFHLDSQFFAQQTLKNLVYSAPFIAPLAYTGVGLLILLNRMVDDRSPEWAAWVLVLAFFGFAGNFVLSLADHAQNGFHHPTEWIGVVAAAFAASSLLALMVDPSTPTRRFAAAMLAAQVAVGLLGFGLHIRANLAEGLPGLPTLSNVEALRTALASPELRDAFLYGAPAFAPLLFVNLAALGAIGVWAQARGAPARAAAPTPAPARA